MTTPRTALEECLRLHAEYCESPSVSRVINLYQAAGKLIEDHGKALSEALGGWLPIELAPLDGTFVLAWLDAADFWQPVQWDGSDAWVDELGRQWHCITYFQPLPPPPTSAEGSGE